MGETELLALHSCKYASAFACSEQYIILPSPINKTQARIHSLYDKHLYKDLVGHNAPVNYFSFGNNGQIFVTACKNSINIWAIENIEDGEDFRVTPTKLGENFGIVTCITFSKDDEKVAICIENEIWVIRVKDNKTIGELTLNESEFIAAQFSQNNQQFLVSISDANLYQIWDLDNCTHIYQSTYLSVANVSCLCVHPMEQFFAIGFDDGMVRIYDMSLHNSIHQINFSQMNDIANSVLTIEYFIENSINPSGSKDAIQDLLDETLLLAIGCSSSIHLLDGNSLELKFTINFSELTMGPSIATISQISFSSCSKNQLVFAAQHVLSKDIHIFKTTHELIGEEASALSVLSNQPLLVNSILRSSLTPSTKKDISKVSNKKGKTIDKMNQPLTFNKKIKSSGYTRDKPRQEMFKPNINKKKSIDSTNRVGPWSMPVEIKEKTDEYPMDSPPPSNLMIDNQLSKNKLPINDLQYSDSGKSLLVAMAEETALLLKPKTLDSSLILNGHNGSVNTARMAHNNKTIITSGTDRTVKLWYPGVKEPVININRIKHNFRSDKMNVADSEKENPLFGKDIGMAIFYYNDQFILLSHGNSLLLYKYYIEEPTSKTDDIKRYLSKNRYKSVKSFDISNIQNITSFSAINSFYSYLVLCACSNRDLSIFDMNEGRHVHTIEDMHRRPTLSLCQNQGSLFVSHSPEAYDLFLTTAPTDGVKLWDLRLSRCVRRYEGHMNRAHKVGLAFSPCARYIAVGSEDKSTYIYDVRSNSYLHRLSGHNDVVSTLAFHPQKPMLATGSLSGLVKVYTV